MAVKYVNGWCIQPRISEGGTDTGSVSWQVWPMNSTASLHRGRWFSTEADAVAYTNDHDAKGEQRLKSSATFTSEGAKTTGDL